MDDMTSKLSELLGSPQGVENLKALANSLFADNGAAPAALAETPAATPDLSGLLAGLGGGGGGPDLSALLSQLGGGGGDAPAISPQELSMMMKVFSSLNGPRNDDRSNLLFALKPHLSAERQERVDRAAKLLKLASLLPLLKEFDFLKL